MNRKLVFSWRGFGWLFRKDWYSFYRWTHPQHYPSSSKKVKLIDIGMFSLGIRDK